MTRPLMRGRVELRWRGSANLGSKQGLILEYHSAIAGADEFRWMAAPVLSKQEPSTDELANLPILSMPREADVAELVQSQTRGLANYLPLRRRLIQWWSVWAGVGPR